ncbi:histone-lysine N-methyltransferase, H3 lysine-79 specific-like [Camellia sinensis]|uniref:histone-lysine N-methyltransferase, H3 lysine-79 specific-like n=1 Tax=Camellia sinensis TaxID=4442 RepID=UPI0010369B54|nr:histone-lysine N-methyltransferase, H3 lysine-79 specific-like [Camellia sinensis]
MLQEDFNPTFSERDIPLSQMFEPTVHNSPDQTYQRKRRRVLISIDIEDEESPNSTPKEASQTPSNTQPHHPSEPSDPILNQSTLNNSPDVTLEAFPMEVLYPGTTEPMNFPSVTSLDSSQNGNPTSIDEIPTRYHCDISSPLNDQFNEPSQSKFQTNPETETEVEGTPTNGPEPTNESNTEVRTEKMDNAPSSDKQVGEHTPTPMDDSHGINQTTGVKNMEQNPSVNENTEDINPHATSEPPGISPSLQALEVPSTLISLETPHVSMEKTTIGETSTPITNPLNPASTVVQASSSSNTGSLSIWEEIAAFQTSVEHISPLPKSLHHFNPEDQQVVSSFLNLINTSFEEIISKQSMETLNCLTAIQRLSPTPFSQNQLSHLAQIISEWSIIVEAAQNCRNTIQTKKNFLMAVQTTSDSLITTCQASFNLSDQDRSLALQETRLEAELALVRQKRHELQKEMDKLGHEAKILLSKTENNLSSIQAAKEEFEQAQATFATTQSKLSILAHIFPRD